MGNRYLEEYMSQKGWGSGFHLPIANEENRQLEKQLEAIQRKVVACQSELDDGQRGLEDVRAHTTRSQVLIMNLQKMGHTQRSTLEHARTLNTAAENSLRNGKRDVQRKRTELEAQLERHEKTRADLEKRQEKVTKLSAEIEWDKTAIATLEDSSKNEDTDVEVMGKYFQLDETTIKEGERAYRKMKDKGDKLRTAVEIELSQTKAAECTLQRLCAQFRSAHKSRNDAVELWKSVIVSLKMRDSDLESLAKYYVRLTQNIRTVTECLHSHESLLKTTERNKTEVLYQLRIHDQSTNSLRQHLTQCQSAIKSYIASLTLVRLEVNSSSTELKKILERKSSYETESQSVIQLEIDLRTDLQSVRVQHHQFTQGSSSTDEKFRKLEFLLDTEEEMEAGRQKEIERKRSIFMQATNQVGDLRKILESVKREVKIREKRFVAVKKETDAQYFTVEQNRPKYYELEMKKVRLLEKLSEHVENLQNANRGPDHTLTKLKELRVDVKSSWRDRAKQENLTGVTNSVLQRLKKEISQFRMDARELDESNENLRILLTTYSNDTLGETKTLNQAKFNFQMILLTRTRLQKAVQKRNLRCYSTSKEIIEMETAADERRTEIGIYLKMLEQRKRMLLENKSIFVHRANESRAFVKHWKIKYELVMTSMANSTSETGSSEAFLIVKFAQEKESLRSEGTMWDRLVKEAEEEVEALQNTLGLLSNSNQTFKKSLTPLQSAISLKYTATDKLQAEFQLLKGKTVRGLVSLNKTLAEKKSELYQVKNGVQQWRATLLDRRQELTVIYREITVQKTKLDRASLLTRRMVQQMEEISKEDLTVIENFIKVKCLRHKYEFCLKTVQRTILTFPKLQPYILEFFKGNKIFGKLGEKLEAGTFEAQEPRTYSRLISRQPSIATQMTKPWSRRTSLVTTITNQSQGTSVMTPTEGTTEKRGSQRTPSSPSVWQRLDSRISLASERFAPGKSERLKSALRRRTLRSSHASTDS